MAEYLPPLGFIRELTTLYDNLPFLAVQPYNESNGFSGDDDRLMDAIKRRITGEWKDKMMERLEQTLVCASYLTFGCRNYIKGQIDVACDLGVDQVNPQPGSLHQILRNFPTDNDKATEDQIALEFERRCLRAALGHYLFIDRALTSERRLEEIQVTNPELLEDYINIFVNKSENGAMRQTEKELGDWWQGLRDKYEDEP